MQSGARCPTPRSSSSKQTSNRWTSSGPTTCSGCTGILARARERERRARERARAKREKEQKERQRKREERERENERRVREREKREGDAPSLPRRERVAHSIEGECASVHGHHTAAAARRGATLRTRGALVSASLLALRARGLACPRPPSSVVEGVGRLGLHIRGCRASWAPHSHPAASRLGTLC